MLYKESISDKNHFSAELTRLIVILRTFKTRLSEKTIEIMDGTEACRSWNGIDSDEEIVISGIAGRFPDSDNMNQLRENLFNKKDLVRADHGRWKTGFLTC
ncbi:uncharacterized protein LOC112452432 [Temnothorax curvispinosus]|uniref:Uncharacterized protein LOC112452432 n=1 Tax=Temnothorax curvispinosus TaxID=300111 RepID=A0A6J1PFV1_9HYME|nr:uncharacterized protein LOC112452432 [Temnothorax curvispinosus]